MFKAMGSSPLPVDRSPSPDEAPMVMVADAEGRQLLCELVELLPLEGRDYGLLTPVDMPVCLFRVPDTGDDAEEEPELIEEPEQYPAVLDAAEQALQAEGMVLIRSAVTLTVSSDDPEDEEAAAPEGMLAGQEEAGDHDDEDFDDDLAGDEEVYEHLVSFACEAVPFALYCPLGPLFLLARLGETGGLAQLVEGDELERLQPLVQQELDERENGLILDD